MTKYMVIVEVEVRPESADAFTEAVIENAKNCVSLEPGCHQFDVVCAVDDNAKLTMYEIYESAAAFEDHTKLPHVAVFRSKIQPMVLKQTSRRGLLLTSQKK